MGEDAPKSYRGMIGVAYRRAVRDFLRLVNRSIDASLDVFSCLAKYVIGPCLVCLALGLIGFCTYTFFEFVLPLKEADGYGVVSRHSMAFVGVFCLVNALYNYSMAVLTDPGRGPEYDEAMAKEAEERGTRYRQCSRCSRSKPERCHHCSVCKRCVLKMDHHCPWINNCVGHGNYRYFCLFMLYVFVCCAFVFATFFPHFYDVMFHPRSRRRGSAQGRQCIMTSFMICSSIACALCILGGFHVYLVLTNQTTIEFQTNLVRRREARKNGEYYRNPYDMGRTRNFQQVFGPNPFTRFRWLMPYIAQAPTGTGLGFPSLRQVKV